MLFRIGHSQEKTPRLLSAGRTAAEGRRWRGAGRRRKGSRITGRRAATGETVIGELWLAGLYTAGLNGGTRFESKGRKNQNRFIETIVPQEFPWRYTLRP